MKTYRLPEREHTEDDGVLDYCAEYAEDADHNVPGKMCVASKLLQIMIASNYIRASTEQCTILESRQRMTSLSCCYNYICFYFPK